MQIRINGTDNAISIHIGLDTIPIETFLKDSPRFSNFTYDESTGSYRCSQECFNWLESIINLKNYNDTIIKEISNTIDEKTYIKLKKELYKDYDSNNIEYSEELVCHRIKSFMKKKLYQCPITYKINTYEGWTYINDQGETVNAVDTGGVFLLPSSGKDWWDDN